MRKNAEKMDLSSRNWLLWVPVGSHRFWTHDLLPDPSHDPDVDPQRVTIPLAFTRSQAVPGAAAKQPPAVVPLVMQELLAYPSDLLMSPSPEENIQNEVSEPLVSAVAPQKPKHACR